MLIALHQNPKPVLCALAASIVVGLLLALSACQNLPSSQVGADTPESGSGRAKPYYVRVQPEATGLLSVNDDSENTFLEFGILPPGELRLFDSEGKPLRPVWLRNMAILAGTHQGILLRLGTATSYVSVHPQADRLRKSPLQENATTHELRDRLLQDGQRGAMERALQRAQTLEQTSSASLPPGNLAIKADFAKPPLEAQALESPITREQLDRSIERSQFRAQVAGPNSGSNSGSGSAPNTVSQVGTGIKLEPNIPQKSGSFPDAPSHPNTNAATSAASNTNEMFWPRSQRVFFASNSVGISAPDDGLHRLLADARQSDEIWIAGHTDSVGAKDANRALAKRRADAIKFILTSRGIPAERIVIVRAPVDTYIAGNETEVGRAQNRRVEVTFVRSRGGVAPRADLNPPPNR